jgi:hypothetical protein
MVLPGRVSINILPFKSVMSAASEQGFPDKVRLQGD